MVRRPLCVASLACIAMIAMCLWRKGPPEADVSAWTDRELLISGTVSGKEIGGETQVLYLSNVAFCDVESTNREDSFQSINTENTYGLICYLRQEAPPMGATVLLTGEIAVFPTATNPGEFDQRKYYLLQGYCGKVSVEEIVSVSEEYDVFREGMYRLRRYLSSVLDAALDEQDASVMRAMLLGEKLQMDRDIKKLYQANGIAHILAISGLHISIIGIGLYQCFKRLAFPLYVSAGFAMMIMAAYAVMTGGSVSTIRAVVMFGFMVLAACVKRSYDLPTALSAAALCSVLSEPYVLYRTGFWMSYLAVFGVAVLHPALMEGIDIKDKKLHALCAAVTGGFCVNLATLPVLLFSYYEYPVYSIFLNLLVIPLMSVLLAAGIFTVAAGCIFLPLGKLAGFIVHVILCIYEWFCHAVMNLPGRSWIAGVPEAGKILMFYGVLILITLSGKKIGRKRLPRMKVHVRFLLIGVVILMMGLRTDQGLRITLLDVGQGDGICIRAEGITCLIDGGSSSQNRLAEYQIEPFLKHEGISEIDYWLITHPDQDHCSGYQEMMEMGKENAITVHTLVLPDAYGVRESCAELIALAERNGVQVLMLSSGEYLQAGKLKLTVLHPREGYRTEDVNESSLVVSVEYENFCGIFTGDATAESEREVIRYWEEYGCRPVQLLKVGHHGSSTSTSEVFLQYCIPQVAMISCGRNNRYGHPHEEVVERLKQFGCTVYRTDESGALSVYVRGGKMWIEEYLQH
ncbi:MAG: DNA internalization-related competence protein ComEC/Rec2 [Lachnospiraceae bacterium]|nr:DNA internalization-related competence protein ComEC/Rec2 [Lachnospiraceae bacterium]